MEQSKKKRAQHNSATVVVLVGLTAFIYFFIQVVSALGGQVETVSATKITAEDTLSISGVFLRDEVLVNGSGGSTVEHVASNGEKVRKNDTLTVSYADENALTASIQLKELAAKQSLLKAALQTAGDYSDTSKLDQFITTYMKQLSCQVKAGNASGASDISTSLRETSLRRNASSLSAKDIEQEIDEVKKKQADLQKQLSGKSDRTVSPAAGYYAETVDGYENIFTMDSLPTMTCASFDKLSAQEPDIISGNTAGKIVRGFTWYFISNTSLENANRLKAGQTVSLRFSQTSDVTIATLSEIRKSEDAKNCLLIFKGSDFDENIVSMRKQEADIILGTYAGLKIPKEAVRMIQQEVKNEDGSTGTQNVTGVYILSGTIAKFKKITPVFETDTYFVIRQSAGEDAGLVIQDPLIIKGKGISDKKVIK